MGLRGAIVLALGAALAWPAGAAADAPWSEPVALSADRRSVFDVGLAFTAGGRAVASWTFRDGVGLGRNSGAVALRKFGATSFGAERVIARLGVRE